MSNYLYLFLEGENMEDILDGIKKIESYETKKQQWDVVREITGKQDEKE